MVKLGYKLMSEAFGPRELVLNGQKAELAGFDFAAISDHFFPWLEEQGHAPLVWPVLGALANTTHSLGLMTAVSCPIMRYHPAIVAQAAATVALLSGDRFTLGIGAGERLNEHITGEGWPGLMVRHRRLREALEIIQRLLRGETVNYAGAYLRAEDARLYDCPQRKLCVAVAAGGPKAARLAASQGDALICTEPNRELVRAYRDAGGDGPLYAEVALCYAATEKQARETALKYFRWSASGWPVLAELPNTAGFAAASATVSEKQIGATISCGPSVARHLDKIYEYIEAGFDHIILLQVGPDQDSLLQLFENELAAALRSDSSG